MRRLLAVLAVLALLGAVAIGLTQAGEDAQPTDARAAFDLAEARKQLRGAPPALAALHAQSGQLLDGGAASFRARLAELEGHPVVVNKWASWCGPCKAEFPALQAEATKRGRKIAFLGLNSGDKRPAAERFLRRYPVPYPSYEDPTEAIAQSLRAPKAYPMTVFIDERGRTAFIRAGQYHDEAELAADIERYLGG